jgi:hypothetical protein
MVTGKTLRAAYDVAQANLIPDAVVYGQRELTDVEESEIHALAVDQVACEFEVTVEQVNQALAQ